MWATTALRLINQTEVTSNWELQGIDGPGFLGFTLESRRVKPRQVVVGPGWLVSRTM